MGYWHSGNVINGLCMPTAVNSYSGSSCNKLDTNICTDACTASTCGPPYTQTYVATDSVTYKVMYGGTVYKDQRKDAAYRNPLVDYGASDAILNPSDHLYFPALQTYPAVAGPVVPIFNIPELKAITNETLILGRATLAKIFRGAIQCWSHESILADQISSSVKNYAIRDELIRIGGVGGAGGNTCTDGKIKVVVRQDSSGTSQIFTGALGKFDPPSSWLYNSGTNSQYDPAYSVQVNSQTSASSPLLGQQKPNWCGAKSDEIHTITVTG